MRMDLQAQKENFEGKINEEIQRIVESIRNSVSVASAHVSSLEQSLARVEGRGAGQDKSSVQLTALQAVEATDDSTVVLRFTQPQQRFPDVLTDLAILPAHLLDTVPPSRLRQAAWNQRPVGNGPFRFVAHEPNRRWVFAADSSFPEALGGPPRLQRLILAASSRGIPNESKNSLWASGARRSNSVCQRFLAFWFIPAA